MDLTYTDEQEAITLAAVAALQQVDRRAWPSTAAPPAEAVWDPRAWAHLAAADLLGLVLPETHGGSGRGLPDLCALLVEVGRSAARLPTGSLVTALALAQRGQSGPAVDRWASALAGGSVVMAVGSGEPRLQAETGTDGWAVHGVLPDVALVEETARVLAPAVAAAGELLVLVDPRAPGATVRSGPMVGSRPSAEIELGGVVVDTADVVSGPDPSAAAATWLRQVDVVAGAAVAAGTVEALVQATAGYVSTREQFGRPLGSFQAVAGQLADAHFLAESLRLAMWDAAEQVSDGTDRATVAVEVAGHWRAEATRRVTEVAQHLHGGVGVDVDGPVAALILAAIGAERHPSSGPEHLAALGDLVSAGAR